MKNFKYFIFLIVAWCIGISNIERVGNLVEVHAAQRSAKGEYNIAKKVLEKLLKGERVENVEVRNAIDNLLKAIVPGQANVGTTSDSPDALEAGLESAIAAYELYTACNKDVNKMVQAVLCSDNVPGVKEIRKHLTLDLREYIAAVRGTFLNHISKHWLLFSERELLKDKWRANLKEIQRMELDLSCRLTEEIKRLLLDNIDKLNSEKSQPFTLPSSAHFRQIIYYPKNEFANRFEENGFQVPLVDEMCQRFKNLIGNYRSDGVQNVAEGFRECIRLLEQLSEGLRNINNEVVDNQINAVVKSIMPVIRYSRRSISGFVIFDPKNVEKGQFAQAVLDDFLLNKGNLNFTTHLAVYDDVLSFGVEYKKFAKANLPILRNTNSESGMEPLCVTFKDKSTTPPTFHEIQQRLQKITNGATVIDDDSGIYSVVNPSTCAIEFFFRLAHNFDTEQNDGRFGTFFLVS